MQAARQAFVSIYGQPVERFVPCSAVIQVSGVGFFDELHGQTGVAPNGIELHPVLSIQGASVPPTSLRPIGTRFNVDGSVVDQ